MKTEKFSLSQLVKRILSSNEHLDLDTDKDQDPDKKTGDETKDADETADPDPEKVDEKKDPETEEPKADAKSASIEGQVSMSIAEFTGLSTMAADAEQLRAENKTLKSKADQWDAYQAAIGGSHADADTSGAKAEGQSDDVKDEYSDLRKKHGALMVGI